MAQVGEILAENFVLEYTEAIENEAEVQIVSTSGETLIKGTSGEVQMKSTSAEVIIKSKGTRS